MSRRSFTYWFQIRARLLLAALVALSAAAGAEETEKPDRHVEVFSEFLRLSRSEAGALLCDPARLEALLRIKIDQPDQASVWRKSSIFSWDGRLRADEGNDAVAGGTYRRFRSEVLSTCSISLRLRPGAFCDYESMERLQAMGLRYWVPWTPPHGPNGRDDRFHLFRVAGKEKDGELWVSARTGERCATSLTVNVPSDWLTAKMDREATVKDAAAP